MFYQKYHFMLQERDFVNFIIKQSKLINRLFFIDIHVKRTFNYYLNIMHNNF